MSMCDAKAILDHQAEAELELAAEAEGVAAATHEESIPGRTVICDE
jgi:hypothetical protein